MLFNGAPSLAQGFYWLTGSMTYTLPLLMLCWATGIGLHLEANPGKAPGWLLAVQGLLVAGATACNEVIIAIPGAMAFGMCLHHRRRGDTRLRNWYLLLLAMWAAVAAAAILAPGNYVRQSLQTRDTGILLPTWLFFSRDIFLEWLREPMMLAFSVLYVGIASRSRSWMPLKPLPALALALGIILVVFFPACWALGRMPPWRVRNVAYILFIPAWMLVLSGIAASLRRYAELRPEVWPQVRSLLQLAAVLILLTRIDIGTLRASSNYWMLAKNFRKHTLQEYDAEQEARYALIRGSRSDTVTVPPLRHLENNMVFFADLGPDPDKFPNAGAAQWFGKKRIILGSDTALKK